MPVSQVVDVESLEKRTVVIKRVAKVVAGGKRLKMSVWVVVGDGNGRVGIGHGKAAEVPDAIQKATKRAAKNMIETYIINGTIPYEVEGKCGAVKVLLKPAAPGTGLRASLPVRAVLECAGYRNIIAKTYGSRNPINALQATINALEKIRDPKLIAKIRGKPIKSLMRRFFHEAIEGEVEEEHNREE